MRPGWLASIVCAAALLLPCAARLSAQAQVGESFGVGLDPAQKSAQQFHGGFYHLFRSDALDARNFFAARVDPYRYRDFRFALAGPLFVPSLLNRHRKNWFFAVGGSWSGEARPEARRGMVPTAAERAGDFRLSPLCTEDFRARFPACAVPASEWSPYAPAILAPFPLPNAAGNGFNYVRGAVRRSDVWQQTGRIEYSPPGKWKAGLRISHEVAGQSLPFQGSSLGNAPVARRRTSDGAAFRLVFAAGARTINAFNLNWSRSAQADRPLAALLVRRAAGYDAPELFPENPQGLLPAVSVAGFTGYSAGRAPGFSRAGLTVRHDYWRSSGSHEWKLGAQWTRSARRQEISSLPAGALVFSPGAHSTGNPLADLLLGRFASYQEGSAFPVALLYHQADLALADKWKLRPRFVVEYGLNYLVMPAEYEARGRLANFIPQRFDRTGSGGLIPGAGDTGAGGGLIPGAGDAGAGMVRAGQGTPRGLYAAGRRNFSPRAALAWQPFKKRKMAVRAGAGISFDRPRLDAGFANNPARGAVTMLAGSLSGPAAAARAPAGPPSLLAIHPDFPNPAVYNAQARLEQEWGGHALGAEYKFSLGRHLLRQRDLNRLRPGALLASADAHPDALRPFPGYATIAFREAAGNSDFHALELTAASRKPAAGITYQLRYSFAKVLTDSTGEWEFPQDQTNIRNDRGAAAFDRRHTLVLQYAYQPKLGAGLPAWAARLLRGWEITGVSTLMTGRPFDVVQPGDRAGMGGGPQRPDLGAAPALPRGERRLERWFNVDAFRSPAPGSLGNAGRYLLAGPGMNNTNLSLARTMALSRRWKGHFRAEFNNALNHPSFDAIGAVYDPATYFLPTSNFGRVISAGPGRTIQLTFKFLF